MQHGLHVAIAEKRGAAIIVYKKIIDKKAR